MSRAELRIRLALDGANVSRLEFDSWRVVNGRDPEWSASDRKPLSERCQCAACKAAATEPASSGLPAT